MLTATDSVTRHELAPVRLMQLLSPNLPVGAFSYSQGLEWVVERAWVNDVPSLQSWLLELLHGQMQQQELPLLAAMYRAAEQNEMEALQYYSHELLAYRETSELRAEEANRGRALAQVLLALNLPTVRERLPLLQLSQHTGFAWACQHWGVSLRDCLQGFAWSWLENAVLVAVKTVPLGQSDGQRVLYRVSQALPAVTRAALKLKPDDVGYASMAVAYASSAHETQYTRLYRS